MPILTENEIKAKIADGSIFAISVDTAVFDRYGCNLDFVALRKLDQFANGPIRFLISEIVINEMQSHIERDAKISQQKLGQAIKNQSKRWKIASNFVELLDELALSGDPKQAGVSQIQDYVTAVSAEVIPASGEIDVSGELLRRYFATEPPFEANDKKKYEFPDGYALLSLEGVVKQSGKLILCVSPDKGWKNFAEQSESLVCVSDLDQALSYFNDSGRHTADETIARLRNGAAPELLEKIEQAVVDRLDDTDFYPDGSSGLRFDSEPIVAVMQLVNLETLSIPLVIAADDEEVTFTTSVEVGVEFEANFSFYVKDGMDNDYVSLGSEDYLVDDSIVFEIAITVNRDFSPEIEVGKVEVIRKPIDVDFGSVEPFPDDDPTHEKY